MALSRIFLIATALVAVLMIQCPLVARSQFCDANYPNPQRLSIDGNVEVVDELFSLVDGLEAQRFVLVSINYCTLIIRRTFYVTLEASVSFTSLRYTSNRFGVEDCMPMFNCLLRENYYNASHFV